MKIKNILCAVPMVFSLNALAADVDYEYEPAPLEEVSISDLYVGGSYGTTASDVSNNEDKGWQVFTGVTFWRTLGLELGHANLGEQIYTGSLADISSTYARLTLNIPLGNQFYFAANGGWQMWDADTQATNATDYDGNDKTLGVGFNYRFEHNLIARVGVQRYYLDADEIDFNSIGVAFYF